MTDNRIDELYFVSATSDSLICRVESFDFGDFAALILLDQLADFNKVDQEILLQRLQMSFGTDNTVLEWYHSNLSGRTMYVSRGSTKSQVVRLVLGVPQ